MERRTAVRYRLRIPATFCWHNPTGQRFGGEGITRDISDLGAYIFSSTRPPVNAEIDIEIGNTRHEGEARTLLRGRMRVVRVEENPSASEEFGFSLSGRAFTASGESNNPN